MEMIERQGSGIGDRGSGSAPGPGPQSPNPKPLVPAGWELSREMFAERVQERLEARQWDMSKLARAMGINPSGVWDFLKGKTNKPEIGVRICRELGLSDSLAGRTCGLFVWVVPEVLVAARDNLEAVVAGDELLKAYARRHEE